MPFGGMKENLSKAYIHMIASAAGLDLGDWNQDYDGFDITLSSGVDYSPALYGPKLDIQLKCTGQESVVKADHISWSLETRTIDYLSRPNRSTPAAFCVLVSGAEYWEWLELDAAGLLAKSHMYWLRGQDLPAVKEGQSKQTVHLPKSNLLTPASILDLMEEASRWRPDGF